MMLLLGDIENMRKDFDAKIEQLNIRTKDAASTRNTQLQLSKRVASLEEALRAGDSAKTAVPAVTPLRSVVATKHPACKSKNVVLICGALPNLGQIMMARDTSTLPAHTCSVPSRRCALLHTDTYHPLRP